MCQGLCDLKHVNYVINSSASFGGGKKLEVVAKQLFPKKFLEKTPFSRKKLSKIQLKEFEKTLESEATWHLDKEAIAIYHMQCEKKTKNRNAICDKCEELRSNKRLNEALKVDKSLTGLRYSEHLLHFFSLLSESSREYEIFRKAFAGLSVQRIQQIRRTDSIIITNPDLALENFMKFSQIIPIGKVPPMMIVMILTKGNKRAEQIAYLIRQVIEMSHIVNLNILSFGADGARSEFNAQSIIMKEASNFLE
ncbi:hypothetical protein GLOIN_2v1471637 [Rhizophagus clarus]|uniref:Uncharacterized protein n=1 Tax=Rhizophagus clarus TaxID=94130 RepID=A0A8H3MA22_9GLOM|nr:hypothetical protein GLOIN_2v1471637 [Rhizophagus clarus]